MGLGTACLLVGLCVLACMFHVYVHGICISIFLLLLFLLVFLVALSFVFVLFFLFVCLVLFCFALVWCVSICWKEDGVYVSACVCV